MDEPDDVMARIGEGIGLSQHGQRAEARAVFTVLWADIGPDGDPMHRCALSHAMADVQDDSAHELTWDLRALAAADEITEERAAQAGLPSVAGLYPSLHLNLGESYRKVGDLVSGRRHLQLGREAVAQVATDDGYMTMISDALDALATRLHA